MIILYIYRFFPQIFFLLIKFIFKLPLPPPLWHEHKEMCQTIYYLLFCVYPQFWGILPCGGICPSLRSIKLTIKSKTIWENFFFFCLSLKIWQTAGPIGFISCTDSCREKCELDFNKRPLSVYNSFFPLHHEGVFLSC